MWYCHLGEIKLHIWKSPNQPILFIVKDDLWQTYFHSLGEPLKTPISLEEIESIGIFQQYGQAHVT